MNAIEWTSPGRDPMWQCGVCGITYRSPFMDRSAEAQAESCCRCGWIGCDVARDRNYTLCAEHLADDRRQRDGVRRAKELAVPLVDPADVPGMVCHDTYWYSDLDSCLDDLADMNPDRDWATTVVWPGTHGYASCPDLAEIVRDHWAEQYELDILVDLSDTVEAVLNGVQSWLEEHAPECWTANTRVRIDMAKAWAEYDTRQSTLGWSA